MERNDASHNTYIMERIDDASHNTYIDELIGMVKRVTIPIYDTRMNTFIKSIVKDDRFDEYNKLLNCLLFFINDKSIGGREQTKHDHDTVILINKLTKLKDKTFIEIPESNIKLLDKQFPLKNNSNYKYYLAFYIINNN